VGDLRKRESLGRAIDGVRVVYLICPNVSPDEVEIGRSIIGACRQAGVERVVYHSVLHPQIEAMPHHWSKLRVEELLLASNLDFTILQPAAYMQNVLAQRRSIVEEGVYPVPYAASTRLGMIDLADVAEVAARVLTEQGHERATYELASDEVLTQSEVAEHLSRVLARPVRVEEVLREEWEAQARLRGVPDFSINCLLAMFRYYERCGFWGNGRVLAALLGRPAVAFGTFAREALSAEM